MLSWTLDRSAVFQMHNEMSPGKVVVEEADENKTMSQECPSISHHIHQEKAL